MTPNQAVLVAVLVQEGAKEIRGEKDPIKARSIVDSYVMDVIRKNWKQTEIDQLGATDIQEALNLNPNVPNIPALVSVPGQAGVVVLSNQNFVTSGELARQMEENNAKLLAAMERIIAAQPKPEQPPTQ